MELCIYTVIALRPEQGRRGRRYADATIAPLTVRVQHGGKRRPEDLALRWAAFGERCNPWATRCALSSVRRARSSFDNAGLAFRHSVDTPIGIWPAATERECAGAGGADGIGWAAPFDVLPGGSFMASAGWMMRARVEAISSAFSEFILCLWDNDLWATSELRIVGCLHPPE